MPDSSSTGGQSQGTGITGVIAKIVDTAGDGHLISSSAYGICNTASTASAKVATMNDAISFTLIPGMTIHIYFENSNAPTGTEAPTLNVNNTGAKPLYCYGSISPGPTEETSWKAGSVLSLTYDTTVLNTGCWIINDWQEGSSSSGIQYMTSTEVIDAIQSGWGVHNIIISGEQPYSITLDGTYGINVHTVETQAVVGQTVTLGIAWTSTQLQSITYNGASYSYNTITTSSTSEVYVYSFTMPDGDVTITITTKNAKPDK